MMTGTHQELCRHRHALRRHVNCLGNCCLVPFSPKEAGLFVLHPLSLLHERASESGHRKAGSHGCPAGGGTFWPLTLSGARAALC